MGQQGEAARIEATDGGRRHRWLRYAPVVVLVVAMALVFASGAHRALTIESLVEQRAALRGMVEEHTLRSAALYVAAYVAAVSLSLPGAWWFTAMGGFLFGWLLGGVLAVVAATVGASLIFLAARTSFADLLVRKAGPALQKIAAGFRQDAFLTLLGLRLIPVFPFWLVNLAPALVGVPLRVFVPATLLGIVPGTFAFAVAGDGLDSVIEAHQARVRDCEAVGGGGDCAVALGVGDLVTPELIAAIAALGLVTLLSLVLKRRFGARLGGGRASLDGGGGDP